MSKRREEQPQEQQQQQPQIDDELIDEFISVRLQHQGSTRLEIPPDFHMILRLIRKQISTLLMRPSLQADEAKRISQLLRLSTQCTLLVHDVLQQQMHPRD